MRHSRISNKADSIISDYRDLHSELVDKGVAGTARDRVLRGMVPESSNDNLFKGRIDTTPKSINFGFTRVWRLCQPYAAALLTKYSNYQARAAFNHDFGRDA